MPVISVISCRFGWGFQGDQANLAAVLPHWQQVDCSGSIQPEQMLEPFRNGCTGVLICACSHGKCHFQEGEWQCGKRVALLRELLAANGIDPCRLAIHFGIDPEGGSMEDILREHAEKLASL